MKARFSGLLGLLIGVLLCSFLAFSLAAQDKASKKAKAVNVQGMVTLIKKDTSTITVDTTAVPGAFAVEKKKNGVPQQVMYGAGTKFLYGHSDKSTQGSVDKVQQGWYISCSGTLDAKSTLMATDCVYREKE